MIENRAASEPDVILVGAGIMGATLGIFLKELEPALNILMVESLDGAALESSDAGTTPAPATQRIVSSTTPRSGATAASTSPRRWT